MHKILSECSTVTFTYLLFPQILISINNSLVIFNILFCLPMMTMDSPQCHAALFLLIFLLK